MTHRFLTVLLLGLAAACNSPQGPPMHRIAPEVNATLGASQEVVVPGDTLEVRFVNFDAELPWPEPTFRVLVPADGRVELPGSESFHAAGSTPDRIGESLSEVYSEVLGGEPAISVNFVSRAPRTFHVVGAVRRPGEYPIEEGRRVNVVEAFARAGGVTYLASYLGSTVLVRWDAERQQQVSWVVDARPKWWDEPDTILLQANDVLFVPDTTVAKVNAWLERYIIRMIPFPRFIVPAAG